jgi:putative acetyltransferase
MARHRFGSFYTIVAEHDGFSAGFASYEYSGHLDLLFTHPTFARQGVAMRLYRRAESAMLAAGVSRVFTEASLAARPLFEHCGFEIDCEEIVECRGAQLRRYTMHKLIRAG